MGRAHSREGFVVGLKFRFTWACPRVWLARSGSPESDAISQSAVPLLGSCLLSGATPWTVLGFQSHGLGMQGMETVALPWAGLHAAPLSPGRLALVTPDMSVALSDTRGLGHVCLGALSPLPSVKSRWAE